MLAERGARVRLEPAWLLHRRRFRDSSDIAEFLTANHGRVACVARGLHRRVRGGTLAARLQPFSPLLISYQGRGELKTLTAVECASPTPRLEGRALLAGLYLNELLVRVLHGAEATPMLLAAYGRAVEKLAGTAVLEPVLRCFEFELLDALGYGLDLAHDALTGLPVREQGYYVLDTQRGIVEVGNAECEPGAISGAALVAMARGEFGGLHAEAAKRLLRQALAERLGPGVLRSRELFLPMPRTATAPGA